MRSGVSLKFWIGGFFLSLLIITGISFLFGDSVLVYTWSSDLGTWIRPPGTVYRHRSEGWGTAHFGQLDVIGVRDISKTGVPAIAIWGDSHVEAFQVEQWEKMQEQLVDIWKSHGRTGLTAFGIGKSEASVADYYFQIPHYEKKCPSILAHVIIISGMDDVLPDQPSAVHGAFESKPEYRLVEHNRAPAHVRVRAALRKWGLDFVWLSAVPLIKDTKLRFSPGPAGTGRERVEIVREPNPGKAFSFLLSALRRQTAKPVTFVYCPEAPTIKGGKVDFADRDAGIVPIFAEECRRNGIGFIDMTRDFRNYYEEEGAFPRGFSNSRPSQGHFNSGGHRLVAKAIYRAYRSMNGISDALHTH